MLREGMYEEQVARGIRLLDQVNPGWQEGVNWDALDMESIDSCILAQLYGGYNAGTRELSLFGKQDLYGFDVSRLDYESETPAPAFFGELQHEWKKQMDVL